MTSDRFGLIVFDWDGTLVDSLATIVDAMRATIEDLQLPPRADSEVRAVIGLGFIEAIAELFPEISDADHGRLRELYREQFLARGLQPQMFPGARETLTALAAGGVTLAVATGKGRVGLDRELANTGLAPLIRASRCADECASKPAPVMLEQLMAELGHAPERTLMVGDAEFDLLMASNAGTAAVGISGGAHDDARLWRHKPLAVLRSVAELPTIL